MVLHSIDNVIQVFPGNRWNVRDIVLSDSRAGDIVGGVRWKVGALQEVLEPLSVGQNTPFRNRSCEQTLRNTATLFAGARSSARLWLVLLEVVEQVESVLTVLFVQERKESVRIARNGKRMQCGYSGHGMKVAHGRAERNLQTLKTVPASVETTKALTSRATGRACEI